MILTNYVDFRFNFGVPATTDVDGHRIFWAKQDPAKLFGLRPFNSWDYDPVEVPDGIIVTGHEIDLSINDSNPTGTNDVTPFVDEWHWYLSDPAAATGNPRWEIVRNDPGGGLTRSARVTLRLTAFGESLLPSQTSEFMSALLCDTHLYAIHIANDVVVWADLHQCAFAPDSRPATWPL